jgi:hypothetical protein
MSKVAWIVVVAVAVGGCVASPLGEPSLTGLITNAGGDRILVEENPQDTAGSAKAAVRISEQTEILYSSGARASRNDLRVGERVRVWFTGPVAQSYPVQATAERIEILER